MELKGRRLAHADDVRYQIREKEQVRIAARNAFFEEGVKLDEEARTRRQKLDEIKKKKLEELRYVYCLISNYPLTMQTSWTRIFMPSPCGAYIGLLCAYLSVPATIFVTLAIQYGISNKL